MSLRVWGVVVGLAMVAGGFSLALSPPAIGQNAISATVTGTSYSDLVRKAEMTARQKIAEVFKNSGADTAQVTINGKNGSAVAPVLDVQISRVAWNKKPATLRPYSNYYDVAGLLGFNAPPVVASAEPSDSKDPKTDPKAPKSTGKDEQTPKTSGVLKLVKSIPAESDDRVLVNKSIELTFEKDLPAKTGAELGIKLEPELEGAVTIEKNVVIFTPSKPLDYSKKYTLTIAGSAKLKLPGALTIRFKTEPQYTYDKNVRTFLAGTCTSCHSAKGTARTSPLDTYAGVMQFVSPGSGGQILDFTGFHGQTRIGAFGGFANAGAPAPPGPPSDPNVSRGRRTPVITPTEPTNDTSGDEVASGDTTAAARQVTRGGALSAEQVNILRTWIVQDQAIEK
ncbi:MAG: Ig-like domain-containing protein [Anaerolineae bacterium]|nr:Ig-like domain-containing protein [Gloeobacterales cyanobacterium ES-bin-313]